MVHMGLDMSLMNYSNCLRIISDINNIWLSKKSDDTYKFINPKVIHTSKWKFDYITLTKNV